jgi:hypothetical protein
MAQIARKAAIGNAGTPTSSHPGEGLTTQQRHVDVADRLHSPDQAAPFGSRRKSTSDGQSGGARPIHVSAQGALD